MENRFIDIVNITLKNEGEESFDVAGGFTKWGFAQKFNPDINVHVLDKEGAIKRYYQLYWIKPNIYRILNDNIAQKVFDSAVCMGKGRSIRILQKAINQTHCHIFYQKCNKIPLSYGYDPLKEDGIFGLKTMGLLDCHPDKDLLLDRIKILTVKKRCELTTNITKRKYLKGWILRAIA